jgi:hypothetical protein
VPEFDNENSCLGVTSDVVESKFTQQITMVWISPLTLIFGQPHGRRRFLLWISGGWNFMKPSLQTLDVGVPGALLP